METESELVLLTSDERFPAFLRLFRNEILTLFESRTSLELFEPFREFFGSRDENYADLNYILEVIADPVAVFRKYRPDMGVKMIHKKWKSKDEKEEYLKLRNREIERLEIEEAPRLRFFVEQYFLDVILNDKEAIGKVDEIIHKEDRNLWSQIHLKNVKRNSVALQVFFKRFYPESDGRMLDRCAATFEPEFVISYLSNQYKIFTSIKPLIKNGEIDHRFWACSFLRLLPTLTYETEDWFFDIIEACSKDPYNRAMLIYLLPDYENVLEERNVSNDTMKRRKQRIMCTENEHEKAIESENLVTEMRKKDDESYKELRCEGLKTDLDADPLSLRPYQEELVETAVQGKNTVVCAPTGAGKTELCIFIATNHLEKKKETRVAMIVPKVPLVYQQRKRFDLYVRGMYYVEGVHGMEGSKGISKRDRILACDIVVLTPQILINMLKSVRANERLYICDFSLLIFDEVHHCTKNHPYNVIMNMVHEYNGLKPQVLGLTASLLHSGGINIDSAMDEIYELLANVGCSSLATVQRHLKSLEEHVPRPDDDTIKVERPNEDSVPYRDSVVRIMNLIQKSIKPVLKKLVENTDFGFKLSDNDVKFEDPLATERYIQKIGTLRFGLKKISRGDYKFQPSIAVEYLEVLCKSLAINDLMPSRYSYQYLNSSMKELRERYVVPCSMQYFGFYQEILDLEEKAIKEDTYPHPIVDELKKELLNQFEKDPHSRAIIFVSRRSTAFKLMMYLNNDRILGGDKDVGYVTSTSAKNNLYGQTKEEQASVINQFNKGKLKAIVATSVVEEGIDVKACNLIIKYNSSSSAVQRIQRRGRARAKGSRSVLLVLNDPVLATEYDAIMAEKMMKKCIGRIQEGGPRYLLRQVEHTMAEHQKKRERDRLEESKRMELLKDKRYDILCVLDNSYICDSSSIRKVAGTNYVVVDESIWSKLKIEPKDGSKKCKYMDAVTQVLGEITCSGTEGKPCKKTLGQVIKYAGVYLPQLSISNLLFCECSNDGEKSLDGAASWDVVQTEMFYIPQASVGDLRKMLNALVTHNRENKIELDLLCEKNAF